MVKPKKLRTFIVPVRLTLRTHVFVEAGSEDAIDEELLYDAVDDDCYRVASLVDWEKDGPVKEQS